MTITLSNNNYFIKTLRHLIEDAYVTILSNENNRNVFSHGQYENGNLNADLYDLTKAILRAVQKE
ncbi:hypothetical protein K438DRAFT_1799534 [Mycena galopus ATCC 62051]|nr:hypothetical protein K438DRAFT_1799534 [Mycena galopus ATCC 62051]